MRLTLATMLTIVVGGPILLVVGILLYNAELSYTARHCDAAMEGQAPWMCEVWLEHCRSEGHCEFASYWPSRAKEWIDRGVKLDICLARAATNAQKDACMGWTRGS